MSIVEANWVCGIGCLALVSMALCVAPLRVVGVESCLSGLSSGLRASAAPCSFAPLQFRALCPEEVGNYGFSSCALRSSGIKELSRPHLGYDLAARGRRKLDSLLTGEIHLHL